jgi:hypothetical protein
MARTSLSGKTENKRGSRSLKDAGAAALAALTPRLLKLPRARVLQPRLDVAAAATVALGVAQKLRNKAVRQRFLSLPAEAFSPQHLDDLELAARAVLAAHSRTASAEAARAGAKIPLDLAQHAAAQRDRMLKLCDYYFSDDEKLGKELRDIRKGTGYLDLASDLHRLAEIYQAQKAVVKKDARYYVAGDEATAERLAAEIEDALGESPKERGKGSRQPDKDLLWRAWALLDEVYDEIAAAGRFLWRHEGGEEMFPSLVTASRRTPHKRKSPPAPASDPQPGRG